MNEAHTGETIALAKVEQPMSASEMPLKPPPPSFGMATTFSCVRTCNTHQAAAVGGKVEAGGGDGAGAGAWVARDGMHGAGAHLLRSGPARRRCHLRAPAMEEGAGGRKCIAEYWVRVQLEAKDGRKPCSRD